MVGECELRDERDEVEGWDASGKGEGVEGEGRSWVEGGRGSGQRRRGKKKW